MADMKRKSVKQLITEIQDLEQRGHDILEELLKEGPLLSGSISEVKRKCGKPNCYCAKGNNGHVQLQLAYTDKGTRRSRIVRKADKEQVREWAERAKRYKEALTELQAIRSKQLGLVNDLKSAKSRIYKP